MNKLLYLLPFTLLFSCQHGRQKFEKSSWKIDPNGISQGITIHDSLTADQMHNIEYLYNTFHEVDSTSREKWIEDFKKDQNPDSEIEIWMAMANAYNNYCKSKTLDLKAKMEVFKILLMRSSENEDDVLTHLELLYLTPKEAREVMHAYTLEAKPVQIEYQK